MSNSELAPSAPQHTSSIEHRFFVLGCVMAGITAFLVICGFFLDFTASRAWILSYLLPLSSGFCAGCFVGAFTVSSRGILPGVIATATGGFGVWLICPFLFPVPLVSAPFTKPEREVYQISQVDLVNISEDTNQYESGNKNVRNRAWEQTCSAANRLSRFPEDRLRRLPRLILHEAIACSNTNAVRIVAVDIIRRMKDGATLDEILASVTDNERDSLNECSELGLSHVESASVLLEGPTFDPWVAEVELPQWVGYSRCCLLAARALAGLEDRNAVAKEIEQQERRFADFWNYYGAERTPLLKLFLTESSEA